MALACGLLYIAFFFPLTFLIAAAALPCAIVHPPWYGFFSRFWGRSGLALAGIRVTVKGSERLPIGPVIVMSNHQSNFDILTLQGYFPRHLSWMAKQELFRIPVFGHSMRRGGYIPLDRSDGRRALKSIEEAAQQIRSGSSVIIFPEGTRTRDGKLLPFKRGGFMLASRANVPVVPVTLHGTFEINPGGTLKLYPGRRVEIRIGEPITIPHGMKRAETEEFLLNQVRTAMEREMQ